MIECIIGSYVYYIDDDQYESFFTDKETIAITLDGKEVIIYKSEVDQYDFLTFQKE